MANAFAPEVKVDIGESNVTPGKVASVDFSGLGNLGKIFSPGETTRPTESDIQEIYLQPVIQDLEVVAQVENPIVREAQFNLIESRALKTVGARYANELKTVVDRYRGVSTLPTTTGTGAEETLVADYSKTEAGKIDAVYAQQQFRNPDGSVDFDGVYSYLKTRALDSAKSKEEKAALEARVQRRTLTAQDGFGQYMAQRTVEVNNHFDKLLSTNVIIASAFDPAKNTTENTLAAVTYLNNEIEKFKAQDKAYLAGLGVDTTKGEFSVDPAYGIIQAKIKNLQAILDFPEMRTKELGQEQLGNLVQRLQRVNPDLATLIATEGGLEIAIKEYLSMAGVRDEFVSGLKGNGTDIVDSLDVKSLFLGTEPVTGSNDMSLPVPANPADLSTNQSNIALSEFSPKFVQEYRKLPAADQKVELEKTERLLSAVTPEQITTPGQASVVRDKFLTPRYLMLSSRGYQDYSTNSNMQLFYGDKSFDTAAAVAKQSPVEGITIYKQMHKAMATEVKRIEIRLLQNLSSMFPSDKNPLVFKEVNGRIIIGLDENAVKADRVLQMELSDIRSKMQNENNAGYPTVVDPMFESKEAEVLVSRYNKMGAPAVGLDFGAGTELHDIMKNFNLLYTQFGKMPQEVQNDPTFGRIIMLDVLENLPKYKIEMGTPTQAEAP